MDRTRLPLNLRHAPVRPLGLPRSSYYYRAQEESAENLHFMRWIDGEYSWHLIYGELRMTQGLLKLGYEIGPKPVRRLLRLIGLMAIHC